MFGHVFLFLLGLLLLIKGGDWFVDGATGIAKRFKIPEILIGATVVSIGTTLPEVMVSATAAMTESGDMAYGNAIGSIICNTALIAAITVAIKPAKVDRASLIIPVCFFFGCAIFFSIMAYFVGYFPRWAGIVLVLTFIAYMLLVIFKTIKKPKEQPLLSVENCESEKNNSGIEENGKTTKFSLLKEIGFLLVGAGLIAFGATLLVEKGQIIARALGVPETVISLTFISIGTSLPELVTAITSLVKGKGALSLGNLIGANLFNLVLVSGIAITIAPFSLPIGVTIGNISASLIIDIPVMFTVMGILTIPALLRGKLSKVQGYILLLIYATFVSLQFLL